MRRAAGRSLALQQPVACQGVDLLAPAGPSANASWRFATALHRTGGRSGRLLARPAGPPAGRWRSRERQVPADQPGAIAHLRLPHSLAPAGKRSGQRRAGLLACGAAPVVVAGWNRAIRGRRAPDFGSAAIAHGPQRRPQRSTSTPGRSAGTAQTTTGLALRQRLACAAPPPAHPGRRACINATVALALAAASRGRFKSTLRVLLHGAAVFFIAASGGSGTGSGGIGCEPAQRDVAPAQQQRTASSARVGLANRQGNTAHEDSSCCSLVITRGRIDLNALTAHRTLLKTHRCLRTQLRG